MLKCDTHQQRRILLMKYTYLLGNVIKNGGRGEINITNF